MIKISDQYCFLCDECPLLSKDDLARRLTLGKEFGEFQFDHLGCDKIGCSFFAGDYCEDAFIKAERENKKYPRPSGLAYRRAMSRKKRDSLIKNIVIGAISFRSGRVDHNFTDGRWVAIGRYVKRPKNSKLKRFYKKYSNHLLRRGAEYGSGKSGYKRCFDYWWELS